MKLGDELRATLNQEADTQFSLGPDVHRLIAGGRGRKRRRNVTRAGVAALAVVLVGGGAFAVTQDVIEVGGSRIANQPTVTPEPGAPPTLAGDRGPGSLTPGTYRVVVVSVPAGPDLEADLTFEGAGWSAGNWPVLQVGATHGGFAVYRPSALGAGSGCETDGSMTFLGSSTQALAQRLARLPGSTLVQPITAEEAFGHDALHLRLRIRDDCPTSTIFRVAETSRGSRGISYGYVVPTTVLMDFWVLDLDGVPVVVDSWHQVSASKETVDRIDQARESITFVTGE